MSPQAWALAAIYAPPQFLHSLGVSRQDCAGHSCCTLPPTVHWRRSMWLCENHAKLLTA